MTIFLLEHTTLSIRGLLTRYMQEIKPGVFCGNITTRQKETLKDIVLKNDTNTDMFIITESEGKPRYEVYGDPSRKVIDFDGIQLIARKRHSQMLWEQVLAKPNETLVAHCVKTGWIMEVILRESIFSSYPSLFAEYANTTKETVIAALCRYAALHDIGKAHFLFQNAVDHDNRVVSTLKERGFMPALIGEEHFRHEAYTRIVLRKKIGQTAAEILSHHHQHKPLNIKRPSPEEALLLDKWQREIIDPLQTFIEQEFGTESIDYKNHTQFLYLLTLGLVITADWVSSSNAFAELTTDNYQSMEELKAEVQMRTREVITHTSMKPLVLKPGYTYTELFPYLKGCHLHPMQEKAAEAQEQHPNYSLILIEGETGSGKTAAGQYVIMNSLMRRNKTSFYQAAPTGAIAGSMMNGVRSLAEATDNEKDNVKLHTGTAWMGEPQDKDRQLFSLPSEMRLFTSIGCGTVDQVMAAAEKLRYGQIRLCAVGTKGIIFDEIHAYDLFMETLNESLYQLLAQAHSPVVMLSATLTDSSKKKIFKAFGADVQTCSTAYPLVSVIENGRLYEYPAKQSQADKLIEPQLVQYDPENMEIVCDIADREISNGGCLGIIVNRVRYANDIMRALKERHKADPDTQLFLLHSRMPQEQKERLTEQVLYLFGKAGKSAGKRPKKAIVVASPILSQSMDMDLDTLITELAPIDELIQRDGRRSRHSDTGTVRECPGFQSKLIILQPQNITEQSARPYHDVVLHSTLDYLQSNPIIKVPQNLRICVNEVYAETEKEIKKRNIRKIEFADDMRLPVTEDEDFEYDFAWEERRTPVTRDIELKTTELLIIPDDMNIKALTRAECISLRYKHAVKIYRYEADKINNRIEADNNDDIPGYLSGTTLLRNKDAERQQIILDPVYGMLLKT